VYQRAKPLEREKKWWESCTGMSATLVRAKRETTLPEEVCKAAGINVNDHVDWRFENGEIRGRKLVALRGKKRFVRPVKFKDLLIAPQNLEIDLNQMDRDIKRERE
jgi:hypothetical protein